MKPVYRKLVLRYYAKSLTFSPALLACTFKGMLAILAGLAPLSLVAAADIPPEQIILECSAGSSDEVDLAGCISARLAQSEATLTQAEESWQRLLESEINLESGISNDVAKSAASGQSPDQTTEQLAEVEGASEAGKPKVIAIVNNTALESGVSIEGSQVINIDDDGESVIANSGTTFDASVELAERFGFLPALFRSYRDQHCALQATLFGADRTQLYFQACLTAMAQTKALELTHSMAALGAQSKSGMSFRGYYVKTESGAYFQACDRKTDWWVSGSEARLALLERRYLDIKTQSPGNSDLLYAELRGRLNTSESEGPGADYSATLSVQSIGLFRPVTESDCDYNGGLVQGLQLSQNTGLQTTSETPDENAATVDDLASSGFLYGYFNYWSSACSVTENTVCSAETEAEFASDGDWQLRVDRSLKGDWRVLLIPTTENQLIEKQLTLQVNGAELSSGRTFPTPLSLAIGEGALIADGEIARDLIAKLKRGRELRFQWFDDSDVMSELKFSLVGISRALQYFDSAKS